MWWIAAGMLLFFLWLTSEHSHLTHDQQDGLD